MFITINRQQRVKCIGLFDRIARPANPATEEHKHTGICATVSAVPANNKRLFLLDPPLSNVSPPCFLSSATGLNQGATASAADIRNRQTLSSWGASARPLAVTTATAGARPTSRGGAVGSSRGRGPSVGGGGGRGAGRVDGGRGGGGVAETGRRREADEAAVRQAGKAEKDVGERPCQALTVLARWVHVGGVCRRAVDGNYSTR